MLTKMVLATLAYYDVLDYPLKAEEVFNYLIKVRDGRAPLPDNRDTLYDPLEVRRELDQLVLERIVSFDEGYYFLFDREYLVPLRHKKAKLSARKLARARRIVRWLAWLPYIEAIFASGSLGLGNCDELSDLDVLVITRAGRIWTARLLITGWLSLWSLRRQPHQQAAPDKICLNHYITDRSLTVPFRNLYNAQTYVNLKPLYLRNLKIFGDFYKHNPWLRDYLLTFNQPTFDISSYQKLNPVKNNWFNRMIIKIGETILNTFLGDWLERQAKNYQSQRIRRNPLTAAPTGHVVFTDEQLAFHPDSPEQAILKKYQALLTHFSV